MDRAARNAGGDAGVSARGHRSQRLHAADHEVGDARAAGCTTTARDAARELLGATLLGGLLAIAFWSVLTVFPHLWMFFLWMLLFGLLIGRKLYALSATRQSPGFWLNTWSTLILLLGQSVQDSAAGKECTPLSPYAWRSSSR